MTDIIHRISDAVKYIFGFPRTPGLLFIEAAALIGIFSGTVFAGAL